VKSLDAANEDQLATLSSDADTAKAELRLLKDFENSIEAGFQMATFQGPLCAEPVVGMAWVVESIEYKPDEEETEHGALGDGSHEGLTDDRTGPNVRCGRCADFVREGDVSGGDARLEPADQVGHVHV